MSAETVSEWDYASGNSTFELILPYQQNTFGKGGNGRKGAKMDTVVWIDFNIRSFSRELLRVFAWPISNNCSVRTGTGPLPVLLVIRHPCCHSFKLTLCLSPLRSFFPLVLLSSPVCTPHLTFGPALPPRDTYVAISPLPVSSQVSIFTDLPGIVASPIRPVLHLSFRLFFSSHAPSPLSPVHPQP